MMEALAQHYRMNPHSEGGYYAVWYNSPLPVSGSCLTCTGRWGAGVSRPSATAILYLCPVGEKSSLHCLKSDEIWCVVYERL